MKERGAVETEAGSAMAESSNEPAEDASTQGTQTNRKRNTSRADNLIVAGAWLVAVSLVILAAYLAWDPSTISALAKSGEPSPASILQGDPAGTETLNESIQTSSASPVEVSLPPYTSLPLVESISRRSELHTVIPTRPRDGVTTYTVISGDSIFSIAQKFNLKPETVLWANYALLSDAPDTLTIGMELFIPPVDGVLHTWKEGDTFEGVAGTYKAKAQDILFWPGNDLDLVEPTVEPGQQVMVPGGKRELVQWIVPTIARGKAGVSKSAYGPGACEGSYEGLYGGGGFVWPTANRVLSGNDFWSGHLAIDIAAGMGDGIFASDTGVVVFSGWAYGGYGNMIMIDHGNGYQTLYSHLSATSVRCGQSVYQGSYIGASGSTGNSTGAHLHFEVRYMGGFINPWHVLP